MLSKEQAKNISDKALSYSKLPKCEVRISNTEDVFIRFANNGITTSGYRVLESVSVSAITGDNRAGSASVTSFTDESLRRGVEQAESLAAISRPDPESMPALGPQKCPALENFQAATASARGDSLITPVKLMIDGARAKELTAAGLVERTAASFAVANKTGLFGYHEVTDASLVNTVRNTAGTSSGWAAQASTLVTELNGGGAARIAVDKCLTGVGKRRLEPGKYTVILEPAAVADLMTFLGFGLSARDAEQGQSFLSRQGKPGETLLGDKLFPESITLRNDPLNSRTPSLPWSDELLANEAVPWIEKGVVRNLAYDRFWAQKASRKPTPFPSSGLLLEGQDHTLEDLIKAANRALLITRFWYVRMLQPQTLQLTGLTRDGVLLVENGKIVGPVMNFRWNESPVRFLKNAKMLTRPVRTQGSLDNNSMVVPAVLSGDFNFASISDAV